MGVILSRTEEGEELNLLTTEESHVSNTGFIKYSLEREVPKNQEMRGRFWGGLVGVSIVSLTIVYVAPVIIAAILSNSMIDLIVAMSGFIYQSIGTSDSEFVTFALGLLAVGVTLFVLTLTNVDIRRKGELEEAGSIVILTKIFNFFLSILFMLVLLSALNCILSGSPVSVRVIIVSCTGVVLTLSIAAAQGANAYGRRAALECNRKSRDALNVSLRSIPYRLDGSPPQIYWIPAILCATPLVLETVILYSLSREAPINYLLNVGAIAYAQLATALTVYLVIDQWNNTRWGVRSRRIFKALLLFIWILASGFPLVSVEWQERIELKYILLTLTSVLVLSSASIIAPNWYMRKSRKFRRGVTVKQGRIMKQRIISINAWEKRQQEWLQPIVEAGSFGGAASNSNVVGSSCRKCEPRR